MGQSYIFNGNEDSFKSEKGYECSQFNVIVRNVIYMKLIEQYLASKVSVKK